VFTVREIQLIALLIQVKALALGAKGVGLGRSFLFANACYGEEGVQKVYESESIDPRLEFDGSLRIAQTQYLCDSPALGGMRSDGHAGSTQDFRSETRDGRARLVVWSGS